MRLTVLVPTYRRPLDLERCLNALRAQSRPADEILVTVRDSDDQTKAFLSSYDAQSLPLRIIEVKVPGVVAAMNRGAVEATGEIIALIDDDAVPFPDWLGRIERHFLDDRAGDLGGVGGRDWQVAEQGNRNPVGLVTWYGRIIGNHHLGFGDARFVDVLKGANCAYRAAPLKALGFDERLRGDGAQVHWELALCLALRRAKWRLVYDPAVAVHHYVGRRFDDDQNGRGIFSPAGQINAVHNETLILASDRSFIPLTIYMCWALIVGSRADPGIAQLFRLLILNQDAFALARWRATLRGRMAGLGAWVKLRGRMSYPAHPIPAPQS